SSAVCSKFILVLFLFFSVVGVLRPFGRSGRRRRRRRCQGGCQHDAHRDRAFEFFFVGSPDSARRLLVSVKILKGLCWSRRSRARVTAASPLGESIATHRVNGGLGRHNENGVAGCW
ncbi:unnamed protein product, partial [Hapterophycus canaliculatus]